MNKLRSSRSMLYRLTLDAMFVAINVVLGMVNSEISWQSLPVLVCAFLMRPGNAIVVSLLGSFVEQLRWGLGFATVLYMLPWLLFGILCGFGAMWWRRDPKIWKSTLVIVVAELVLNLSNTAVLLYLGYAVIDLSSPWLTFWGFLLRTPQALVRAVLSSVTVPLLLPPLQKALAKLYTRPQK